MTTRAKGGRREPAVSGRQGDVSFGRRNHLTLIAALACILIGFLLLSRGSVTAAPLLLVLGYCVLVPYGLTTGRDLHSGESGE